MNECFDITGQKFNKWTVIERADPPKHITSNGRAYWHCICDCGRESILIGKDLRTGHSKSCGCSMLKSSSESRKV